MSDTTQPINPAPQAAPAPTTHPVTTVSMLPHEGETMRPIGNTNWAEISHPAPEISPQLEQIGVEKNMENHILPQVVSQAGIELTKEATPVLTSPTGKINIPWTEAKAQEIIKTDHDTKDSLLWLATLVFHELEAAKMRKALSREKQEGEFTA